MVIRTIENKTDDNEFSPRNISALCSKLSPISSELHSRADEIQFHIDAAQRLIIRFNAGQPDAMADLITVGRRLSALLETAVTR